MGYVLTWGIHRGTLTSRDIGDPYKFKTEKEAAGKIEELKKRFAEIGYFIWFANINGKQVFSTPYQ
jgi:hypothetical protein